MAVESGTYKKAHRHGPGAQVIVIAGKGYSLMWHPGNEVVRAIGPARFRTRLARKYRKLAAGYLREEKQGLARAMYWKAYKENVFDLRYLWKYLMASRREFIVSQGR